MMNMFALGLEEVFQPREHLLLQQCGARLGYAYDLHLFGNISVLKRRWNMVIATLKQDLRSNRPNLSSGRYPRTCVNPKVYLFIQLLLESPHSLSGAM